MSTQRVENWAEWLCSDIFGAKNAWKSGGFKNFFWFLRFYAKIAVELSWLVSFSNAHSSSVLTHSVHQ